MPWTSTWTVSCLGDHLLKTEHQRQPCLSDLSLGRKVAADPSVEVSEGVNQVTFHLVIDETRAHPVDHRASSAKDEVPASNVEETNRRFGRTNYLPKFSFPWQALCKSPVTSIFYLVTLQHKDLFF